MPTYIETGAIVHMKFIFTKTGLHDNCFVHEEEIMNIAQLMSE